MFTKTTKSYEIAVRITEYIPGNPPVKLVTNGYVSLEEFMDLIDDEQARQIKEAIDDESRS